MWKKLLQNKKAVRAAVVLAVACVAAAGIGVPEDVSVALQSVAEAVAESLSAAP